MFANADCTAGRRAIGIAAAYLLPDRCLAVDRDGQVSEKPEHATLAQLVEQLIRNQ